MHDVQWIWDDGGRASSGFVGIAGDCVTRSIAIATGWSYGRVYRELFDANQSSPRDGVPIYLAEPYLKRAGWKRLLAHDVPWDELPQGVVIVDSQNRRTGKGRHWTTVIDHTVYDTWNPVDDEYQILAFWTPPPSDSHDATMPAVSRNRRRTQHARAHQDEFDKILNRIRALDNTASNDASTEGEKRNALRMMQNLMLRHNLSREDLTIRDDTDNLALTRMACPVNGRRACRWEKDLAHYLTEQVFPMVLWYVNTKGHRTLFWFYGPLDDVEHCIQLFRELLLTIATSARIRYGGHSRGSGASYCEGYVLGLPTAETDFKSNQTEANDRSLIQARVLSTQRLAEEWLNVECGIRLVTTRSSGRFDHDPDAARRGEVHGSQHDVRGENGRKRIGN
ncbi:DUF2786 domain-containing protein [Crateriforma spongiae]|uniref:DUF2786 domain-containing protein n=1 Tax=Crateriforma spongiae TaxID=2724528 RepID=UPI00197F426F